MPLRSVSSGGFILLLPLYALWAALAGCSEKKDEPETGSTGQVATEGGSGTTAQTSATTEGSSSSGSESGEVPGELSCDPKMFSNGAVVCLPNEGGCAPCDEACMTSEQVDAYVDGVLAKEGCCSYELRVNCGPALIDDQCCYVFSIGECSC